MRDQRDALVVSRERRVEPPCVRQELCLVVQRLRKIRLQRQGAGQGFQRQLGPAERYLVVAAVRPDLGGVRIELRRLGELTLGLLEIALLHLREREQKQRGDVAAVVAQYVPAGLRGAGRVSRPEQRDGRFDVRAADAWHSRTFLARGPDTWAPHLTLPGLRRGGMGEGADKALLHGY